MKKLLLVLCTVTASFAVTAQVEDPVVMTVNGVDVTLSEFEY